MPSTEPAQRFVPGQIAVTFTSPDAPRVDEVLASVGALHVSALQFTHSARGMRIIYVDPSQTAQAMTTLRSQPGVLSVTQVGYRFRMTIPADDPYYQGFAGTTSPYFESTTVPGQWDMHAIDVAGAWNQLASTPPVTGAKAPIAVVDTGVDVTHPELRGGAIVRTRCFVTYPSGAAQSTGAYVTDTDGHGTDVAGIAAGDSNNALGFASTSYDAKIMAYRIFPSDPSGGCDGAAAATNPQCGSDEADEAAAINDAVTNGAKVINLSLGAAPPCSSSSPEYQAVENAIAHNVVVVAAAGNGDKNNVGQPVLDCPAADPGVIAVGASSLDDSNPLAIKETIAGYSNYVTSNNGRFLLAPGGFASGTSDTDDLHWIENIYSSTGINASSYCTTDYGAAPGSPVDCRVDIEGTSQAAPHVAGVAAMILAARPSYTPAQVAAALCASAVDIGLPNQQGCGRVDANAAVAYALAH